MIRDVTRSGFSKGDTKADRPSVILHVQGEVRKPKRLREAVDYGGDAVTDGHFLAQLKGPPSPFPDSFHVLVGVNVNDGISQRPVVAALHIP